MTKLWRDIRGTVVALVAFTAPILLGVTGLGVEAGLWYVIKRHNQTAADFAAYSGALELQASLDYGLTNTSTGVYSDICALAKQDATNNGFTFASFTCPTTSPSCTNPASGKMCVNNPPQLGAHAGNNSAVEVILNQQQNTLFASLAMPNVNIMTRAVALVNANNQVCLLALASPSSPKYKGCKAGFGICIQGSASLNAPGCSVVSDSTGSNAIDLQGGANANIIASTISTAGNLHTTGSATTDPATQTFQPPIPDPYASTLTHANLIKGMPTTACPAPTPSVVGGVTWSVYPPNCVVQTSSLTQSNIVLSGNTQIAVNTKTKGTPSWNVTGTVLLNAGTTSNAGTYWVTDGDLNVSGTLGCTFGASTPPGTSCSVASGAGVTIILTTAKASNGVIGTVEMPPGNTSTSLNAPTAATTATFKGDLVIQDSNGIPSGTTYTTTNTDFQGTPSAIFTGLLYLPNEQVGAVGNASLGNAGCLVLVVNSLAMIGNPSLNTTGCTAAGVTTPLLRTVALAE